MVTAIAVPTQHGRKDIKNLMSELIIHLYVPVVNPLNAIDRTLCTQYKEEMKAEGRQEGKENQ